MSCEIAYPYLHTYIRKEHSEDFSLAICIIGLTDRAT